jgi:AmmeMemoRadiSam system protein A
MKFIITDEEKRALLSCAREAISAKLEQREAVCSEIDTLKQKSGSVLQKKCGAFVTLHKTDNSLRGCIGMMNAVYPLEEAVRTMALEAAFGDPRFPPLCSEELADCKIEISVLSPMELCLDPNKVIVGVHGLYLTHNGRSGVLLPQVPLEAGWNREEYLDYICIKAGLPGKSYVAPGAKLYTFSAIVFGENSE